MVINATKSDKIFIIFRKSSVFTDRSGMERGNITKQSEGLLATYFKCKLQNNNIF